MGGLPLSTRTRDCVTIGAAMAQLQMPLPSTDTRSVLDEIHDSLWAELELAAQDRQHGWRLAALATQGLGGDIDVRSVVLREVDVDARHLVFYTDARSGKVRQMLAHPRGKLLLWSAPLGWQLRLDVALTVETEGLAVSSRWARLKLRPSALDYLSPLPPGTPLGDLAAPDLPAPPTADSRPHFAVVTAQVQAMDWLSLNAVGHRRARFLADGSACWLQA